MNVLECLECTLLWGVHNPCPFHPSSSRSKLNSTSGHRSMATLRDPDTDSDPNGKWSRWRKVAFHCSIPPVSLILITWTGVHFKEALFPDQISCHSHHSHTLLYKVFFSSACISLNLHSLFLLTLTALVHQHLDMMDYEFDNVKIISMSNGPRLQGILFRIFFKYCLLV